MEEKKVAKRVNLYTVDYEVPGGRAYRWGIGAFDDADLDRTIATKLRGCKINTVGHSGNIDVFSEDVEKMVYSNLLAKYGKPNKDPQTEKVNEEPTNKTTPEVQISQTLTDEAEKNEAEQKRRPLSKKK